MQIQFAKTSNDDSDSIKGAKIFEPKDEPNGSNDLKLWSDSLMGDNVPPYCNIKDYEWLATLLENSHSCNTSFTSDLNYQII